MSIYLKKAFSFGPFRLNLSKSGIGLSFGVTGLRIGTGAKGPYIHAGRGGLYFRQSLKDTEEQTQETVENIDKTPAEPLTTAQKIYKYTANFLVAMFIFSLVISFGFLYVMFSIMKVAANDKRKSKIKRSSKRR